MRRAARIEIPAEVDAGLFWSVLERYLRVDLHAFVAANSSANVSALTSLEVSSADDANRARQRIRELRHAVSIAAMREFDDVRQRADTIDRLTAWQRSRDRYVHAAQSLSLAEVACEYAAWSPPGREHPMRIAMRTLAGSLSRTVRS